jgi:hypothetical protein
MLPTSNLQNNSYLRISIAIEELFYIDGALLVVTRFTPTIQLSSIKLLTCSIHCRPWELIRAEGADFV